MGVSVADQSHRRLHLGARLLLHHLHARHSACCAQGGGFHLATLWRTRDRGAGQLHCDPHLDYFRHLAILFLSRSLIIKVIETNSCLLNTSCFEYGNETSAPWNSPSFRSMLQRRRQRNFRCSIVFVWSSHSIGAINSQGSLRGDSGRLATPFTIHLYYQQTTHSSNMRLILNLDYRSAPGHRRLRPPLLLTINPSFLHLTSIPISHGSTPLTHGGNADEEREGRRSVAAGYHTDRHDVSITQSRDTT